MKSNALRIFEENASTGQDYEWYPTTDEIITAFHAHVHSRAIDSLLDIGAGDGKVLKSFGQINSANQDCYKTELFAIEKARPLLDSLPIDISILGTDFWEQSLLDKTVDCIFSNPPYSEFIDWCVKVIREANANYIYLVIPQRWKDQQPILKAIKDRRAEYKVIGEFDFLNAEDRKARAKVDLVFISLCADEYRNTGWRRNGAQCKVDPFSMWVEEFFEMSEKDVKRDLSQYERERKEAEARKKKISNSLVPGKSSIEVLDTLYRAELDELIQTFQKVCSFDDELFKELDISVKSIIGSLKTRIHGLKNAYWNELFDNYAPLTSRLTAASRKTFIESIRRKTNIDFTASNAYAITVWAIRNADQYLEKQMIETFEKLVSSANVINYKSNERVFKKNCWRYRFNEDTSTHFKLDYRIVADRVGGLDNGKYNHGARGGLSESAANFIDDLIVVAKNLGFDSPECVRDHDFRAGKKEEFYCTNKAGERLKLMEVRAYMNGNFHIKFNQDFMLALNIEIGRLQGWIHNVQHAAQEMGEKVEKVAEHFNSGYSLLSDKSVAGLLMIESK